MLKLMAHVRGNRQYSHGPVAPGTSIVSPSPSPIPGPPTHSPTSVPVDQSHLPQVPLLNDSQLQAGLGVVVFTLNNTILVAHITCSPAPNYRSQAAKRSMRGKENHYISLRISNRTLVLHSRYCQALSYTNIIINPQWIVFSWNRSSKYKDFRPYFYSIRLYIPKNAFNL